MGLDKQEIGHLSWPADCNEIFVAAWGFAETKERNKRERGRASRRVNGQRACGVGLGRSCYGWASAEVGFNATSLVWADKEEA